GGRAGALGAPTRRPGLGRCRPRNRDGGEAVGGWVVVSHGGGWLHGGRSADAGAGKSFRVGPSSPRLCVAVEIPRGGWGRDFQRVWEGPGAGVRWPGAFHTRSDSTAGEGGRLGSELAATQREGRGEAYGVRGNVPGVSRTVPGASADCFPHLRGRIFRSAPTPLTFGSANCNSVRTGYR